MSGGKGQRWGEGRKQHSFHDPLLGCGHCLLSGDPACLNGSHFVPSVLFPDSSDAGCEKVKKGHSAHAQKHTLSLNISRLLLAQVISLATPGEAAHSDCPIFQEEPTTGLLALMDDGVGGRGRHCMAFEALCYRELGFLSHGSL